MPRPGSIALRVAALLLLVVAFADAAGAPSEVRLVLELDDQANDIWSRIPERSDDSSLTRLGRSSDSCINEALGQARQAASRAEQGRLALRGLHLTVPISRGVLKAAGSPGNADLARLFSAYAGSSDEADFVVKAARSKEGSKDPQRAAALRSVFQGLSAPRFDQALHPAAGCGPGLVLYDLRARAEKPGRLFLRMVVEGGCGCGTPSAGQVLRRFGVMGEAELEPGEPGFDSSGVTVRWKAKAPRYTVLASCGSCGPEEKKEAVRDRVDPCGQLCGPLAEGITAWQDELTRAAAEVREIDEKVAGVQGGLARQEQEIATLGAKQRKTRTDMDALAKLGQRLDAARSEVAQLGKAAEQAKGHAGELRRAQEELQGADQQCHASCQEPPKQAEQSPKGGGPRTALIAAGGLAVAGAVVAVVATPSSSPSSSPSPAPSPTPTPVATPTPVPTPTPAPTLDVSGRWTGLARSNGAYPQCGLYEASLLWELKQEGTSVTGSDYRVVNTSSGPCIPCGCPGDVLQGELSGSLDGNVLEVLGAGGRCIVRLVVTGDTMSGTSRLAPGSPGPCGGSYALAR